MRRFATSRVLAAGFAMAIGWGQQIRAEGPDLAELRSVLADQAIPADERAHRALDGAAALDQSARESSLATDRRVRWTEAVGLLDDFVHKNPEVEAAGLIRFQAAVYRWAAGAESSPSRPSWPRPTRRVGSRRSRRSMTRSGDSERSRSSRRARLSRSARTSGSGWPRRSPTARRSNPRTTRPGPHPSARRSGSLTPH